MRLKFWGVRGSVPTPQLENLRYGGNTPCLELRSDGGALIILDCGSGMRMLGKALTREFGGRSIQAHVLLSHYHWDHIQGLPFFLPLYQEMNEFRFHSFRFHQSSPEQALEGQMANPYFPLEMSALPARRKFFEIDDTPFTIQDVLVRARLVNHPQGCLCFRFENAGKVIAYATDNEPGEPASDRAVREMARDADLLIYDSQYSRDQLSHAKKGWGHSTWEEGVLVSREAGVKKLILFHHDPDSDDKTIDRIQESARALFPNTQAAFEGMEIIL